MPRATEDLTPDSDMDAIREAIHSTIEQEVEGGHEPRVAAAIAYREACEKTGKRLMHADPEEPFEVNPDEPMSQEMGLALIERLEGLEADIDTFEEEAEFEQIEGAIILGQLQTIDEKLEAVIQANGAHHDEPPAEPPEAPAEPPAEPPAVTEIAPLSDEPGGGGSVDRHAGAWI